MKKNKRGFTLAELLIVTAIIEMLVVTSISIIRLGKQE
ncbi:MAG: prepilin-type N-terminal cleavage/methylation domain-containing protein [Lachnospiraceae bacterium]|jgi:Tfp pilus assembly protein PilE|nr:prepilin-type N-terminal cleavage/methylation domain-containing protein [Lachnospiraceae bacterium]